MVNTNFICKECQKKFKGWKSQNRKYCSNECRLKALHRETPDKRRTGRKEKCEYCGKEFYVSGWQFKRQRGKYCSQECYWKDKSNKYLGEGNPQYIDERTKKYAKAFYFSIRWRKLRKKIYERDNWTCKKCGKKGGELHAHHIIPVGKIKNPYVETNILTLCRKCHQKEHSLEQ